MVAKRSDVSKSTGPRWRWAPGAVSAMFLISLAAAQALGQTGGAARPAPIPASQPPPTVGRPVAPQTNAGPPLPSPAGAAQINPALPGTSQPTTGPATDCHGQPLLGLIPPPPDQPQPKFASNEESVTGEPAWAGQQALCVYTFSNAGQGVLVIQLKPG